MYFQRLAAAAISAIYFTSPVYAVDYKSRDFSLQKLPEIEVRISDGATNGCWTGISAARSNLSDKLELLGVQISEKSPYRVLLEVNSSRTNDRIIPGSRWRPAQRVRGGCFGSARILIYKKDEPIEDNTPLNVFLITDRSFIGYDNANNLVFAIIDDLVGALK